MGLKKYEIITVGSDKRVRALRSWQVGDRYVNIGDVGGIVYDEKTLSQDGACWLFRGNFGFPGARIGGDSIVDIGEAALSTTGAPAVDIVGSSVVVGSKLQFKVDQAAEDIVVLTADDFEQGTYGALIAGTPLTKVDSGNYVRLKNPFFAGGKTVTLKCGVPGYSITAIALDRDGFVITNAPTTATGAGVTITVPAGQYFTFRMSKDPISATVPADATAAQITFTGTYETKLSIIDSRVEINPATSTGVTIIKPGGSYSIVSGAKYPEAVIRNSKVSLSVSNTEVRVYRMMGQFIGSTAMLDATASDVTIAGIYSNVKNLTASGIITSSTGVSSYDIIQATDCDNFAVSSTIFPGLAAAQTANMPFIFRGCNVPNGIFYHHAQIANTYNNIDFALAQADLGKLSVNGYVMVSSEVEGMHRLYAITESLFGALVEAHDSVKSLNMTGGVATYGTIIYKDAYFNGIFSFAGTNVFGNKVRSHPLAQVLNVQPRAVQGMLNTTVVGETITGVVANANRVCVPKPFRINSGAGLSVNNVPAGIEVVMFITTRGNVIVSPVTGTSVPTTRLKEFQAYLVFLKTAGGPITPEDLAGVTVTVYNGCKIVNTGTTAVNMKGNIRVEDNATLVNASVTGSGYFGGNSIIQAPSALVGPLPIEGAAYMSDNAVFVPHAVIAGANVALLDMRDNAVFAGSLNNSAASYDITMMGAARCLGTVNNSRSKIIMRGNSFVAEAGTVAPECRGLLTMKDDARVGGNLVAKGHITLCGSYNQTTSKSWTGKRVIDNENAPEYDNNVKTQYDF